MPLLEEGEGKANQVVKELRSKREVERVLDDDNNERPKPGYGDRQYADQRKTKRQDEKEIYVSSRYDLVDRDLEIEWACDHENFQRERQGK